jgi:hypothetical protein
LAASTSTRALNVEHALGHELLEPLVLRLPARVAGLRPLDTGLSRDDACLGGFEPGLGGPKRALGDANLDLGALHGSRLLGELLVQVGDPHVEQDVAFLDAVTDVVPVPFHIAGDPGIDGRHLVRLNRSRLDHGHLDVPPLGMHDPDSGRRTGRVPARRLGRRLRRTTGVPTAGRQQHEQREANGVRKQSTPRGRNACFRS